MTTNQDERRARVEKLASEFNERGDPTGWFEALYAEAAGNNEVLPWGDLEPNRFVRAWAERTGLRGDGRNALVVGCGLGDDARFLDSLGFDVTAFDISPTAIAWAKKLHADTDIRFEAADVLEPFRGWLGAFDFVLEVYTIQPLPVELRGRVIDSIASFIAKNGRLLVVTRGREDDEEVDVVPWPLSKQELERFRRNGLKEVSFEETYGDDDNPQRRFIVEYRRPA